MTVLFLYTEIAEYFIKCCENLSQTANVHIIRWPVNKEAPFVFSPDNKIKIYDKTSFTYHKLEILIKQINPSVIVCSGWIDKDYLKLVKPYFKKIPTVLTCDTRWNGSLKQHIAKLLSPFFLLNTFSHAWVPGQTQVNYLKKLGFATNKINTGFYCCDLKKFNSLFNSQIENKKIEFPKRFLFVGRYYGFKGVSDLWEAFIQLQNEMPNEWELWCLGTGSINPIQHKKIKHFGFVQPANLDAITKQAGVFVLPSHFEPWGVVVQEFSASGFPLITSSVVGANEAFLVEGSNGFTFKAKNILDLKLMLKKIINLNHEQLLNMAQKSHNLAQKINHTSWTNTLLKIHDEFNAK